MIERMKKVTLFTQAKNKKKMLLNLRKAGLLHITDLVKRNEEVDKIEKDSNNINSIMSLMKDVKGKDKIDKVKISNDEFDTLYTELSNLLLERKTLSDDVLKEKLIIDAIKDWGEFDPKQVAELKDLGVATYYYTLGKKELEGLKSNEDVVFVRLKEVQKMPAIAVIGKPLDRSFPAVEFSLPEKSLAEYEVSVKEKALRIEEIDGIFKKANAYEDSFKLQLKKNEEKAMFSKAASTSVDEDGVITYITGYVPSPEEAKFKELAKKEEWAYIIAEPTEEDNPPTLVKYKGVVRIIKPLFDILGTVPGYREYDTSAYFLVFFTLFFAMIIGDAGYGLIFTLVAVLLHVKSKKLSDMNALIYVCGIATVIWGSLTGTWFGSAEILQGIPFLQKLVIPQISTYPEIFYGPGANSNNAVMKFCFILGVIQLALARVINIITKAKAKDLSLFSELGWLISTCVLYLLVLFLVIGAEVNFTLVIAGVAIGFVLVCVFSAQGPGIPFVKGLLGGLGGFFTTFLDTISSFSNIMSYIRLFAVGMATVAIADSFNQMAIPMFSGFAFPAGVLIVFIGHALNLVMGLLSVVVHGVRLNLLEFSGSLGMEWTGYEYEPFSKTVEENNVVGNN